MGRLLLTTDDERAIVLEAPRVAAWVATAVLMAAAVAVRLLLPGRWIAPAVLTVLAVWRLTGALQVHRLALDLGRGVYDYRRGFVGSPPRRRGRLDEVAGVAVERNQGADGLAESRLRSRRIVLEFDGWPDGEGRFGLGFPMGPRVAADRAADYARRLGTGVVDRTAKPPRAGDVLTVESDSVASPEPSGGTSGHPSDQSRSPP
jgi:hypothetical protein